MSATVVTAKPAGTAVRRDLRELAPRFAAALAHGLNQARWAGYDAVVFEAHRTRERQRALYAQGRTTPGAIVTHAASELYSWHGYGLAVDVVSRARLWNVPESWYRAVAEHLIAAGLDWGGDWPSFRDLPHFQWGRLKSRPSDRARELIASGGLAAVWKEVGAL